MELLEWIPEDSFQLVEIEDVTSRTKCRRWCLSSSSSFITFVGVKDDFDRHLQSSSPLSMSKMLFITIFIIHHLHQCQRWCWSSSLSFITFFNEKDDVDHHLHSSSPSSMSKMTFIVIFILHQLCQCQRCLLSSSSFITFFNVKADVYCHLHHLRRCQRWFLLSFLSFVTLSLAAFAFALARKIHDFQAWFVKLVQNG